MVSILVIVVKRHHVNVNPYKAKHLIGVGLKFQKCSPYCHGGKYGGMQVDMVPEEELRVPHLSLQAVGREDHTLHDLSI